MSKAQRPRNGLRGSRDVAREDDHIRIVVRYFERSETEMQVGQYVELQSAASVSVA